MLRLAEMTTGLITSNISQLVDSRFLKCNFKTYSKIPIGSVCQGMGRIFVKMLYISLSLVTKTQTLRKTLKAGKAESLASVVPSASSLPRSALPQCYQKICLKVISPYNKPIRHSVSHLNCELATLHIWWWSAVENAILIWHPRLCITHESL